MTGDTFVSIELSLTIKLKTENDTFEIRSSFTKIRTVSVLFVDYFLMPANKVTAVAGKTPKTLLKLCRDKCSLNKDNGLSITQV